MIRSNPSSNSFQCEQLFDVFQHLFFPTRGWVHFQYEQLSISSIQPSSKGDEQAPVTLTKHACDVVSSFLLSPVPTFLELKASFVKFLLTVLALLLAGRLVIIRAVGFMFVVLLCSKLCRVLLTDLALLLAGRLVVIRAGGFVFVVLLCSRLCRSDRLLL